MGSLKAEILVQGSDAEQLRGMLDDVFDQNRFRTAWSGARTGVAKKGNRAMNVLFGALAQYHEIGFELRPQGADRLAVRLQRQTSGFWGGLIGAANTKKRFRAVRDLLADHFEEHGILVEVTGD
ncbi:MAG: hypothetical protein IPM29_16070 [Planctomycetes bacterium]|nr:hypothetical protein [Planctomycetota bacterium]